ncbi:MAG: type II/IV secretion system ATPase subunit [Methanoregula sp.]|jgi:flagellar protein FlaI|nr:type II/IV secretion system ATPase subunit [Methanoregula sp.]
MLPNIPIILSAVMSIISLNGVLGALVNLKEQIPGLGQAEERHEPTQVPVTVTVELPPRPGLPPQVNYWYSKALDYFCAPTQDGIIMTGILVFAALATTYVALLVDLDLLLMAAVSLAALLTLATSGLVLKTRYERKSWFAFGKPASPVPAEAAPIAPVPVVSGTGPDEPPESSQDRPRPELDEPSLTELEWYWVAEPYSYVKIQRMGTVGFTYFVTEPAVSQKEKVILLETHARLRDVIIFDESENGRETHIEPAVVDRIIREFDPGITEERIRILNYYIKRDLSGYGPLEVLMRDPALEDISCNGHSHPVFIFHRAYGSLPTNIVFSESELNQFVLKLAQKANKQISLSNPLADATLPDGARVQITYSDVVSTKGSSFTIRKFRAEPMTPIDLLRFGTFSAETLAYLWLAIEHHKSLLVVGGTASGKTSMMNAVSLFIPQNAKIVSLEDTREIQLPHKNWLPTQTRELTSEGMKGDIDMFSLLKACMRQRPEFIIVGEVRGREAQTLFQAMNSGHATLSTIHAGSVYEAINRLTHDPINVPSVMFQALDLVVVQSIYTLGKRRIRRNLSIHEVEVTKSGEIVPRLLFEWDIHSDSFTKKFETSRVLDEIAFHCGWGADELARQLKMREEFFTWAMKVETPTIHDLANAIHDLGE